MCERLMEMGVLAKDTHETTVRLAPPLCVTQEDLDWAAERILTALAERLD
jgi:ornithine--oxo-acid transaminase